MIKLEDILKGIDVVEIIGSADITISDINFDSRKVGKGDVFVAVRGVNTDGHNFIANTLEKNVSVVICEAIPDNTPSNVTFVKVGDSSHALGLLASNFYGNPSSEIKIVGITGTNGKTTTATLLHKLFTKLGYKAGLVSTIKNFIGENESPSTHTTPDQIQLQQLFRRMVDEGCEYCFMEVSSHAIHQNRISGIDFNGAVFTNITHDHLDYHKTFKEYINVKKSFFDILPKTSFAISNVDDKNGEVMFQNCKAKKITYSLNTPSDYKTKVLENHFGGMLLSVNNIEVWSRFIGRFNAYNFTAVYSVAIELEQNSDEVLKVLSGLGSVDGRFEYLTSKNNLTAVVDYAHTPDALLNVLNTIIEIRKGTESIVTVVGAGGDRDKSKRPEMARIASEKSDRVILTSDNPRTESPEAILKDMEVGVDSVNRSKVISITDRKEAIRAACLFANPGDIILVAGKGHETYQEVSGIKTHFDDKEVIKEIFKNNNI